MKKYFLAASIASTCMAAISVEVAAQPVQPPSKAEASSPAAVSGGDLSAREQGYLKLLEGQRHLWKAQRLQSQAGKTNSMRLAKAAFQKAIEIDPQLAEAYTALAEISVALPPVDLDEAVKLASQAVAIDKQNFGGHRMLARLYTIKSRLNGGTPERAFADKAVSEWKEVTRLDPRNAEGWAFLSEFAENSKQPAEQIEALRNWVGSAAPLDVQFYGRVMNGTTLTPETASLKLAAALERGGKTQEAITILSELIAEDPENSDAVSLLGELLDSAEGDSAKAAIGALQQAVYANPENTSLVEMLTRLQGRLGQFDEAVELLRKQAIASAKTDPRAASTIYVSLAELYLGKDRYDDSIKALEESLSARGIGAAAIKEDNREFAQFVFEKMIHTSRLANRPAAAKAFIERSGKILGVEDSFADRQLIALLRAEGNQREALTLVRSLRAKRPAEIGLLREEAWILTSLGRVDEAVALVRGRKPSNATPSNGSLPAPTTDDFSDLLFVSNLYMHSGHGRESIEAANQAVALAGSTERRQIARVTLATGQQMNGDFAAAEVTLRDVLKENPGNPIALNNLGYFLVERGEKPGEAVELIGRALKIDPKNPSYLDSLGWAYFKMGKLSEAEKYLSDAARADADSSTIREHLGDLHSAKNDPAKAKTFWERALRLATEPAEIERLKRKLAK